MVTTDRQSGNPYMSGKLLYCIDPINERYLIAYDLQEIDSEEGAPKQYTYLTEVFDHRPSLHEVAEVIYRPYNDLCDVASATRRWRRHPSHATYGSTRPTSATSSESSPSPSSLTE